MAKQQNMKKKKKIIQCFMPRYTVFGIHCRSFAKKGLTFHYVLYNCTYHLFENRCSAVANMSPCFCVCDTIWTILEKAMAAHSSTLAWKIPWTEEPGRLQSVGSRRVGHDWATSLSLFTFMHWRRKWQPTPVFLPGESQGQWSLVGCRLWGCTESDMTEAT